MQRIIYKGSENNICILTPADGCELSIDEIAQRGVPSGTPYDIVDASDPRAKPALTNEQTFAVLRHARDARLTATDKYLLSDYPIDADTLAQVKTYRAALRDLPDAHGAPWDGGGDGTPWPIKPNV